MSIRRRVAFTTFSAVVMLGVAGPAFAGEVTGNGKPLPVNGKSVCAYSGLNDEITDFEPTRVQNYGIFVNKLGYDFMPSPGLACNPTTGFEE